jgi:hypothetical protein
VRCVWIRDELHRDRIFCSGTDNLKTQEIWDTVRTSAGRQQRLRIFNAGHEDADTTEGMPKHSSGFRTVCHVYRRCVNVAVNRKRRRMNEQMKQGGNFLQWQIFIDEMMFHISGRVSTQNVIVMLELSC